MIQSRINIDIKATPVFYANKTAYDSGNYRAIVNEGGSRSSKTYSISQLLITIALSTKKRISVVSHSLPHLKKGARKDILDILDTWQIFKEDNFNRTDNIYSFPETGSYIEFFGADEEDKVKGPSRDILYINEANLLGHRTYTQLEMRTTETVFMDLNPSEEYSWVYTEADKEGNKRIHSTYRNNLTHLSKATVNSIESLKDADENMWQVFGLGLRGKSSETIYTHYRTCTAVPYGEVAYGLDFGYNHPTALIKCTFADDGVYVEEVLYESRLTTNELADRIKALGIVSDEIYCDHSRPETIEELSRCGLNVHNANKDVFEGISKVKSMPLFIHQEALNTLTEIRNYKWKIDKDGKVVKPEQPIKILDDAMDAMRYAIYTHLTKEVVEWGGVDEKGNRF